MRLRASIILCSALAVMATVAPKQTNAQVYDGGTTTSISGTKPVFYTADYDTLENAGYLEDTIKITETQATVMFFLHSDKISGNHGGYWRILGSPAQGVPFAPITTINIANGDSTYSHVITGNPYTYYKTTVQDTSATQESRYKTWIVPRPK